MFIIIIIIIIMYFEKHIMTLYNGDSKNNQTESCAYCSTARTQWRTV